MAKPVQLFINLSFLKNRVVELGYKQWWLAEQIGVDRKTVNRWLSGQVRSIQIENAEKLAQSLSCRIKDLTLSSQLDQMATEEDQRIAAQVVTTSSLIDKLGPIGEWNVIESLLKATIVPNLPLHVLGDLYNQLCVASWRQSKIEQASLYNKSAFEIAEQLNDKTLLAHALLSQANIYSWKGFTTQSIETYKKVFDLEKFISRKTYGAAISNLGAVLYEMGHLLEGKKYIQKSIESFLLDGTPMNLSIAYCHLAMIELQMNHFEESRKNADRSQELAKSFDYKRGIFMNELILAEIEARIGNVELSEKSLQLSLAGFETLKINEGLNYEFAGRICRHLNQNKRSIDFLQKGIEVSHAFPLSQASLYRERALTEMALGQNPKNSFSLSLQLFKQCQAPLKANEVEALSRHVPACP